MKKINLSDLSIIISIKVDSEDRLRNILFLIKYFDYFFSGFEIILVEQGIEKNLMNYVKNYEFIQYKFINSRFAHYKTRNLNLATMFSTRPYIMMCDSDILCIPNCLKISIEMLKNGCEFVSPHNGIMVQINKSFIPFNNSNKLDDFLRDFIYFPKNHDLIRNKNLNLNFEPLYGNSKYDNTGGCIIYKKSASISIGNWNENIISYGFEDMEFVYRIKKFGFELFKIDNFNIYHMEHQRNVDSYYNNFYRSNEREWLYINSLDLNDLRNYVDNGFKNLQLDPSKEIEIINKKNLYKIKYKKSYKINIPNFYILIIVQNCVGLQISNIDTLLEYLERHFNLYKVFILESRGKNFKYLNNKKNVHYTNVKKDSINTYISKLNLLSNKSIIIEEAELLILDFTSLKSKIINLINN